MKGLVRSLNRAPKAQQLMVKQVAIPVDLAVSVAGTSGVGFGTSVLEGLPVGNILFLGAVAYLVIAGSGSDAGLVDTWSGDFGIGTTPLTDGTISGADVDIVASTAVGPAVAEVSPRTTGSGVVQAILDNTGGALEVNLNVLVDDANISATVPMTATGEVYISYVVLGA